MKTLIEYLHQYNFSKKVIGKVAENNIKLKRCKLLFFTNAITIYPNIYIPGESYLRKTLVNHELIHIFQQKRMRFPVLRFTLEYICKMGYRKSKYEIEAFDNEFDFDYILKMKY